MSNIKEKETQTNQTHEVEAMGIGALEKMFFGGNLYEDLTEEQKEEFNKEINFEEE